MCFYRLFNKLKKKNSMANRNIIDAIIEIVKSPKHQLKQYSKSMNRANIMGAAFEDYCMDLFAGTVDEVDKSKRLNKIDSVFSYIGNQHNPPDMILKDGDAIEVKKIEDIGSTLLLNSSYPKCKLYSNNTLIKKQCRDCDGGKWIKKDMLYIVGVVNKECLSSIAMVYGDDYCDSVEVYEKIRNGIKSGLLTIADVDFAETKELGRVNKIDHLGITNLRIRGMWTIVNPFMLFDYIYKRDSSCSFDLIAIINKDKISTLDNFVVLQELEKNTADLKIEDVKIQDPQNPANLKEAKLITYFVK